MAGGPVRCEKHSQLHCMKCWKEKEALRQPAVADSGSVRDRLPAAERAPERVVAPAATVVAPGTFDPPGDIEGFDAGGPPNVGPEILTYDPKQSVVIAPPSTRTIAVDRPIQPESPEEAAARRYAKATVNLKALTTAIAAAKIEKKISSAEFKKLMNPTREPRVPRVPRVKKPRKSRILPSEDSKPE